MDLCNTSSHIPKNLLLGRNLISKMIFSHTKTVLDSKSSLFWRNSRSRSFNLVWGDKHNVTLMSSLQVLQNKAAKIILDRPLYSSASDALTTLKWLTLEKRRFQRRCVHVYKCLNGLTHHELTLVTQQEQHSYNTRNKANLKIPSVKRNWGKQRTGYHAVSDFNSLDKTIRASDNVNILKRQIFNSLI